VIPTGNDKDMTVDCQTFAQAVDRVSTISSERGRAVKLAIAEGQLTLTVNNPDSGSAPPRNSPWATIAIRSRSVSTPNISSTSPTSFRATDAVFMLADPGSPTLVRDTAGDDALYVLMPMRV
jgi:DNA polymerase-3 subunit beta